MWDFSGDEFVFFFAACFAALVGALKWYVRVMVGRGAFAWGVGRAVLALAPLPPVLVVLVILNTLADPQFVVGHLDYILLFLVGGIAWVFWGTRAFTLLGYETPADVLERRNAASLVVLAAAMLGAGLAYAGSNVGGGPTIWTTLLPALVATATLVALGGVVEVATDTADAITIDRDLATALRTGALSVANGAILGRAMAGDWHEWPETFATFVQLGWPAAALTVAVAALNRSMRPTPHRPAPPAYLFGVVPAAVTLVIALTYVAALGMPEVAPSGPTPPASTEVER